MNNSRITSRVEVLLDTLEYERHTPAALLVAFANELRNVFADAAPDSTRDRLVRAERGEMPAAELPVLLGELRALIRAAA